jgi:hypothetical protein
MDVLEQTMMNHATSNRKVVAVLVAHIYGKRFNMVPILEFARKHNIHCIEDLAEAFSGLQYTGHPLSDLSLFSFGTIKIATAFGGAMSRIKDTAIFSKMQTLHSKYPEQSRVTFFMKIIKNTPVTMLLNLPILGKAFLTISRFFKLDHKKAVVYLIRGFPDNLIMNIRHQPSIPLLHMLHHRLSTYDANDSQVNADKCIFTENEIISPSIQSLSVKGSDIQPSDNLPIEVQFPGTSAQVRNYWLFPLACDNPDEMCAQLNVRGVDAYRGATQLALIPIPDPSLLSTTTSTTSSASAPAIVDKSAVTITEFLPTPVAKSLMERTLYLPVHRNVPQSVLRRIAGHVRAVAASMSVIGQKN